jgi:hypothetical protein
VLRVHELLELRLEIASAMASAPRNQRERLSRPGGKSLDPITTLAKASDKRFRRSVTGTATAMSASRVTLGSARAETASPPTSAKAPRRLTSFFPFPFCLEPDLHS